MRENTDGAERGYHPGESTREGVERMAFDGTPSLL